MKNIYYCYGDSVDFICKGDTTTSCIKIGQIEFPVCCHNKFYYFSIRVVGHC